MKRWISRWLLAFLVPCWFVAAGCGGSSVPVTAASGEAAAPAAPPGPPPGPPGPPATVPGPPAAVPGPPPAQPVEAQPETAAPTADASPPAEPAPPAADPNQPEPTPSGESSAPIPSGESPPGDPQATGALAGAVLDFFSGLTGKPKAPSEGQSPAGPAEPGQPQPENPAAANPGEAQPNPGENPAGSPALIPVLELVPEKSRPLVELAINRAIEAYKKKNPSGPADADELINKVLKPKGIRLPKLPPGAKFVFDPNNGQLMIEPGDPNAAGEAAPGVVPKGARKSIE